MREGSGRPVAPPEGLRHPRVRPRQHVAARAHGSPDQHGLPRELVIYRDERVVRRERPCGALAVHEEGAGPPVHQVLLHLEREMTEERGEGDQVDEALKTTERGEGEHVDEALMMWADFERLYVRPPLVEEGSGCTAAPARLRDVVRDVVHDVHVEVVGRAIEHLSEGLRDGETLRFGTIAFECCRNGFLKSFRWLP